MLEKNMKINKDDWKLNYPLNPVHKHSAPCLDVALVKGRNLVLMKKKTSPIDIIFNDHIIQKNG
jgi:hypothetical protein